MMNSDNESFLIFGVLFGAAGTAIGSFIGGIANSPAYYVGIVRRIESCLEGCASGGMTGGLIGIGIAMVGSYLPSFVGNLKSHGKKIKPSQHPNKCRRSSYIETEAIRRSNSVSVELMLPPVGPRSNLIEKHCLPSGYYGGIFRKDRGGKFKVDSFNHGFEYDDCNSKSGMLNDDGNDPRNYFCRWCGTTGSVFLYEIGTKLDGLDEISLPWERRRKKTV